MAKSYNAGKKFEYEVRDYLREHGWIVKRAYASKGLFDLLAYKDSLKWGIQCKSLSSNKNRLYLTPKENKELCEYSIEPTVDYEFVSWDIKYRCPVMRILNEQFTVIHSYNKFPGIGFRLCTKGKWNTLYIN